MKYISYYDTKDNIKENRKYALSATNKMDYIIKALNEIGEKIDIVSVSATSNNRFYRGRIYEKNWGRLILFPTIPGGNPIFRRVSDIYAKINLFLYLLRQGKKDEYILVYHSLGYGNAICLAKKIKKFKVILEVEEIYQDIKSMGKKLNKKEYEVFRQADRFIFPTEILNNKVNKENKPYGVIHGTYMVEKDRSASFDDDKIHIVYAGTFDKRKGVLEAIKSAEFLSDDYRIHILGKGKESENKAVGDLIKKVNEKGERVIYEGVLSGEEFISFMQKCHIGLSPQDTDASFNTTSFPSKILSYMANGLRVVSVKIPAIEKSAIGDYMYFYEVQGPENIAGAIKNVDFNDNYDGRNIVSELDEKFKVDIKKLIKD